MNAIPSRHAFCMMPPDAKPLGRERHIAIIPDCDGGWAVHEQDEGGAAFLGTGLSKVAALRLACAFVLHCGATLSLQNDCWE